MTGLREARLDGAVRSSFLEEVTLKLKDEKEPACEEAKERHPRQREQHYSVMRLQVAIGTEWKTG